MVNSFGSHLRSDTKDCLRPLESLIFAMFPFDMITNSGFGAHSPAVRMAFRHSFLESQSEHYPGSNLASLLEDRFEEYFTELNREQTGFAGYGLHRLGIAAVKRIVGRPNASIAALCTMRFAGALKYYGPLCDQFQILG